jgi:aryl-alcohol dehydrogenase-like predicted oxidoreductase
VIHRPAGFADSFMESRRLGQLTVSALGLGCMGMSHAYGGQEEAASLATIRRAVELGVTFFDTAEAYGPFVNEELVGKALAPVRGQVVIATKFGFRILPDQSGHAAMAGLDGRPEQAKAVCEASLKRLRVEAIDLFYLHRVDPAVPVEESVGAMADLVRAGKVRAIGLSEVDAATIRRAHAVHPLAAVQSEYSLWAREVEAEVLPTLRELGIGFVPFSPLGRGFLAGAVTSAADLGAEDFRRTLPRFQQEAIDANLRLVARLDALARAKGATKAQIALAWTMAKGRDFGLPIAPIPGTRRIERLEENVAATAISLSEAEMARIEAAAPAGEVVGARYGGGAWTPKKD